MRAYFFVVVLANFSLVLSSFLNDLETLLKHPETISNEMEKSKHSRFRRQEVTNAPAPLTPAQFGFACTTDMFLRMDQCCKVPKLYPENTNAICTPQQRVQTVPLFQGIFRRLFPVRVTYRKNLAAKNSTIKSRIEDICRIHCIFKQQRWLAEQNYVDENLFYAALAILIPSGPYNGLINYARTVCSTIQSYGDPLYAHVNNTLGQKCLLTPFRLLRCVKRSMILAYNTCPGQFQYSQQCDLVKNELRSCDIFSL